MGDAHAPTRRHTARLRIERAKYIANYVFPTSSRFKLDQAYPHLSGEQVGTILQGLRVWFQLVAANPRALLGMPSSAVDTAWHAFILLTQNNADFCGKAFAKFLHHTPYSASDKAQQDGPARTYGLGMRLVGGAALVSRVVNFGTRKVPNFRVRLGAKHYTSCLL